MRRGGGARKGGEKENERGKASVAITKYELFFSHPSYQDSQGQSTLVAQWSPS